MKPETPMHRQYEAIRAIVIDGLSVQASAKKFGYKVNSLYSRMRDIRSGKLIFFPNKTSGPSERRAPDYIRKLIIHYRKENLSATDIHTRLQNEEYSLSIRTIERILSDANFTKLKRRSAVDRGVSVKNKLISERATPLDFEKLEPFSLDCPSIGVFFFLPYIIESGIVDIIEQCKLPKSSAINAKQASLSMLLLKLMGAKRLSHMHDYDHEPGLGVFAGLNVLPKSTFMSTYSCRSSEEILNNFQEKIIKQFQKIYPNFYKSSFINLDFHSIPHFGDESQMEKVWCGARGKAMKGAQSIFAQDGKSNAILYTRADVLRKDESHEIIKFITYWKTVRKNITETLVFDCKFTTYQTLDLIAKEDVKFITLRKRSKKLIADTEKIPEKEWQKITLPIPKRKYKNCRIHVSEITLPKCEQKVKQIIVTNNGRSQPTYVVTNNFELSLKDILIVYAKRWHIENKFAELVSFFNLNALSSPLMIRIHFDILFTVIADTFYHRFAQDLPRFENERANSLSRHFIDMPGQLVYDRNEFIIKIRKRAHTPILLGVKKLQNSIAIPWLGNKPLRIEWTA